MPAKEGTDLNRNVATAENNRVIAELFSAPKLVVGSLAVLTLVDSFLIMRKATPGHGAEFLLGWALVTRLWLSQPSRALLCVCAITSLSCACANHGLLSNVSILHIDWFYYVGALVIVFWERFR